MIYDTIAEFESAKPEYVGLVELSILGWLEQYGEDIAIVVSDSSGQTHLFVHATKQVVS